MRMCSVENCSNEYNSKPVFTIKRLKRDSEQNVKTRQSAGAVNDEMDTEK